MPEPRLTLQSRLEDLTQVWPWVEALAVEYAIPAETRFAIEISLEEALSNVIRHGYRLQPGNAISIEFTPEGHRDLVFTVEDHAPPFDPLSHPAAPAAIIPRSIDDLQSGGRGICLLRRFAGGLSYQRLTDGNRLTIRFTAPR